MYLPADHHGMPLAMLFGKEKQKILPYPFTASNALLLNLGRNCIYHAIEIIDLGHDDVVLLPAYLDDSVVEPFLIRNIPTKFYHVDLSLRVDFEDISSKIGKHTKALLAINYFGFPQPLQTLRKFCDEHNLYFIEDNAHSLLSRLGKRYLGSYGDLSLFSFRKTIPLPDGAALVINNPSLPKHDVFLGQASKSSIFLRTIDLLSRNLQFRLGVGTRPTQLALSLIRKPLRNQYGEVAMSNSSLYLARRIDYDYVYEQRRDHFKFISNRVGTLKGIRPIYESLIDGVCPWGFPVLVQDRDKIQKSLAKHGTILPTHWRLPDCIPLDKFPDSRYLSEHIMTLPVFQGLGIRRLSSLLCKLETLGAAD
jgi:hypothetical protein